MIPGRFLQAEGEVEEVCISQRRQLSVSGNQKLAVVSG